MSNAKPGQTPPAMENGEPSGRRLITLRLKIGARLRAYFLAGVLITAPVSITIYLAWAFITFVDDRVTPFIPEAYNPNTYLPFALPGLGLLIVAVVMTLVGALTAGFVGRLLLRTYEELLGRMPILSSVYNAIKQIVEALLAKKSAAFREAVLVQYPREGLWTIAFVTGDGPRDIQALDTDAMVSIFVPTAPNPTSGFLLFVPRRDLMPLDMSVEDALKLVISVGMVAPSARQLASGDGPQPERK
jgi:uncharacterized membrane protein